MLLLRVWSKLVYFWCDECVVADLLYSSEPNSHPQAGKLLGTSLKTVTLGLDNGIRIHFPREGYIVKKA